MKGVVADATEIPDVAGPQLHMQSQQIIGDLCPEFSHSYPPSPVRAVSCGWLPGWTVVWAAFLLFQTTQYLTGTQTQGLSLVSLVVHSDFLHSLLFRRQVVPPAVLSRDKYSLSLLPVMMIMMDLPYRSLSSKYMAEGYHVGDPAINFED